MNSQATPSSRCAGAKNLARRSFSGQAGWFAAISILWVPFLLFSAPPAGAQISPGPLSQAHQSLSGPTQCTSCHVFGASTPTFRCRECHTEIAKRLQEKRGLHATMVPQPGTGQVCARCHSEHNGEEFNLIHWDPPLPKFDHNKTGYVLEGEHIGVACDSCHKQANIPLSERPAIKIRDLSKTYLGLTRECVPCHEDKHRGQLGSNCLLCHTFLDWKEASRFDHSKTRFPLMGAHARVACEKCHAKTGPQGGLKYKGLAFQRCNDCHMDPHKGQFPQACESCHTTANWRSVTMGTKFDHSKTDFPLRGKHADARCSQCHAGGDFKKPIPYKKCADCHTPDPHSGQFRDRADGGECASCHTEDGFKPSTFGVKQHADTKYPLDGKHAAVDCAKCHIPAGKATRYKIRFAACLDCHKDAHKGQFAGAPHLNRCEDCHTVAGFQPATYTIQQHQQTRFPLRGAHLAVVCVDCHKPVIVGGKKEAAPYRFDDQTCTACHGDPHKGQFAAEMKKPLPQGGVAGCEACHTVNSWVDVIGFDHSKTKFPLLGAHRAVACSECHKPATGTSIKEVDFRAAPLACEGCHKDVHGGQFATVNHATDCSKCHNSARWKPSEFDHEKGTTFSLQGAHMDVSCGDCHKLRRQVGDKQVLFYKPTPQKCIDCHGAAQPGRS